ncbi:SMI1/KNR4 family protein [Kitasatospora cineracea]|uniref:SMI1/KNR4 family protein n=1 Tax=Kitasatospora cineracea TaxID=88074 RepID=UPI0038105060
MGLPKWIGDVVEARRREFVESPDDDGIFGPPVLRAGATEPEIAALQARFSQPLEEGYVEFLRHSDGMENYALGMPVYGTGDWRSGRAEAESGEFLRALADLLHEDAGIPEGTELIPISMSSDWTAGTFMLPPGDHRGRIFWLGHGDLCFYSGMRSLFRWAVSSDPGEIDWIL